MHVRAAPEPQEPSVRTEAELVSQRHGAIDVRPRGMDLLPFTLRLLPEFNTTQRCPPFFGRGAARRERACFGRAIDFDNRYPPFRFRRDGECRRQTHGRCDDAREAFKRRCGLQRRAQMNRRRHPPAWTRALRERGVEIGR